MNKFPVNAVPCKFQVTIARKKYLAQEQICKQRISCNPKYEVTLVQIHISIQILFFKVIILNARKKALL
jgi:hypothetical protein